MNDRWSVPKHLWPQKAKAVANVGLWAAACPMRFVWAN